MTSILEQLEYFFDKIHKKVFPELNVRVTIIPAKPGQSHDYSYNSVKAIYNKMKKTAEISEITDMILSEIDTSDIVKKFRVDGSYINITIRNEYLEQNILDICRKNYAVPYHSENSNPKLIGVDFSSPNIAKEMHVGHLRSTIIGDTICKILEYSGHNVKRINHVGDWGTQFGLLLAYIELMESENCQIDLNSIETLTKLYKNSKERAETDPEFKKRSREMVTKLQNGDPWATEKWEQMVSTSKDMFDDIYSRLGVKFPDGICGESFYNDKIDSVIEEALKKGFLQDEISDDSGEVAKVVYTGLKEAKSINKKTKEPFEISLKLKKADGALCYDSTDAAAVKFRMEELKLDQVIYVTDVGQDLHFKMIFKLAEMMEWSKPDQLKHIKFGMVMDSSGKRFRTRNADGTTVKLKDLLDEAQKKVSKELTKRITSESEHKTTTLTLSDISEVSEKLGMAAIKYADLKNSMITNYKFDYDKMLNFNGDTAIYILYSYARLSSIMRKCFKETSITIDSILVEPYICTLEDKSEMPEVRDLIYGYSPIDDKSLLAIEEPNGTEHDLALFISRFDEFLKKAVEKLAPHILCGYLYNLSELNSRFLAKYRLLNDSENGGMVLDPIYGKNRLLILEASRIVMKTVFNILGIEPLEKI